MNMTRDEMVEERVTVTRAFALKIIKEHGWGPTTPAVGPQVDRRNG